MASLLDDVRGAIEARLASNITSVDAAWTAAGNIAFPGVDFSPGSEWVRPTIIWGDGQLETHSSSGINTVQGILMLSLFDRPGSGYGTLYGYADALRDLFDRVSVNALYPSDTSSAAVHYQFDPGTYSALSLSMSTTTALGMSFVTGHRALALTATEFRALKSGTPTGSVDVRIYDTVAGTHLPDTTSEVGAVSNDPTTYGTSRDWIEDDWTGESVVLSPHTRYVLVIEHPEGGADFISVERTTDTGHETQWSTTTADPPTSGWSIGTQLDGYHRITGVELPRIEFDAASGPRQVNTDDTRWLQLNISIPFIVEETS